MSVARVVEKLVEENPFIQEALARGIISYAALAEYFKKRVDIELKKNVKESAIMMALRRLNEKLEHRQVEKPKFEKHTDIVIRSDLFESTIKKSNNTFKIIQKIYDEIDHDKDFLTVTQGITQVTIISNRRNKRRIDELLKHERKLKDINNLSSVSVSIPLSSVEQSGYFYVVTRAFAWENIPIVEIVSTLTEMNLVINEVDIPKAFLILKEIIEKNS